MMTYTSMTPLELAKLGVKRCLEFCDINRISPPQVSIRPNKWNYKACGYWRSHRIHVCLPMCARLALDTDKGRDWSWPGNTVDREPYGVVAHELGHHVDYHASTMKGTYFGDVSKDMREASGEEFVSGYAANTAEWFAEMFRLFITNPYLLQKLRPHTYELMRRRWVPLTSVGDEREALGADCPPRVLKSVVNKIDKARRSQYAKQKVW